MIPCQREFFEIPDEISYLNCAYLSPVMKTVKEAGLMGVQKKTKPWEVFPNHFFEDPEKLRGLFAQLIHTTAENVSLTAAASYGIAIAAENITIEAGEEIVILDDQFPSNVYSWLEKANENEVTVKTVKRENGENWTEAILRQITNRTKVVSTPQVHWTDGSLINLAEISKACREINAELVLDLTQSLGAYPFSIEEINPSFMVASGYKWLLGPYSTAFLYVHPKYQNGQPIEHNWLNRKGSEDFAALVDYQTDFQPGARRFDVGERSNFTLLPMMITALDR